MKKTGKEKEGGCSRPGLIVLISFIVLSSATLAKGQETLQMLHRHVPPAVASGEARPVGLLSPSKHLHLAIQLPLRNQAELAGLLNRLYDPQSSDFRKYLSVEQFTERFGPTRDDYQKVVEFVKANGMTVLDMPRNRMLVEADSTVEQAEKAFHVAMNEYPHPTEQRTFYSPDREPSLALSVPLSHISGLNNYFVPRSRPVARAAVTGQSGSGPYGLYLPGDLRMAYYGSGPLDGSGQSIGLVTFWGFNVSDVDLTYTSVGLTPPTTPINTVLLGGLTAPLQSTDDSEPITDIVASMSIAPNLAQVREYQCCSPDYDGAEAGQDLIYNSIASENICKVNSESAGVIPQHEVDDPYFEEMAAQGQSFLAASGDGGSPPEAGVDTNDYFYPGDNAWITSVGATELTTDGAGGAWAAESAVNWSGGGYSDGYDPVPIPPYQAPVINSSNSGSTVYRNLPDVAAIGENIYLCMNGSCNQTGGTSFSSPLWAGFIALADQQAVANSQPTVGFLNPILYQIGQSANYNNDFHDMIGGNNDCCGQTVYYTAVTGYDLVSGWGSPNGPSLINDLLAATAGFTLMPESGSLSIGPSDSGAVTILIGASSGFSGQVTLSAQGLPSGVTATFSPNPASGTSTLTLTSSSTATVGAGTVTISGSSGSVSATAPLALTVTATPGNFTVGYAAPSLTAGMTFPGSQVTSQITVTSVDSFASAVALSAPNLPSGMTAAFVPSSVTPAANNAGCLTANPCAIATMVLTLSSSVAAGTDTLTITGTSGALANSAQMPLTVNSGGSGVLLNGIYTVSNASSGLLWDNPSSSTTWGVDMTVNSADSGTDEQWVFTSLGGSVGNNVYEIQNVASSLWLDVADVSTSAGGLLDQWGWNGGTPNQEWLLTPSGNGYVITTELDGMAVDPGANTAGADLLQEPAVGSSKQVWMISSIWSIPSFNVSVTPTFQNLPAGNTGIVAVTVASVNGFNSGTALSISGLPSNVTATFSPSTVTPGPNSTVASIITLTASGGSAQNVAGATPSQSRYAVILLPALFAPLLVLLNPGRRRFLVRVLALAGGVLFLMLGPVSCGGGAATSGSPPTTYTVTVTGTSGTLTSSATFTLYVR
jgi:subtilase family serine protease